MQLTHEVVERSYRRHLDLYGPQQVWDVAYHVECWSRAHRAFQQDALSEFEWLYDQLERYWKVFRGARGTRWSARETFGQLAGLDQRYSMLSLSTLVDEDLSGCWQIIRAMSSIKPTKTPSIVAISKFLHFWNPALFVIVDDAIMWRRVLSRSWIRPSWEQEMRRVSKLLPDPSCPANDLSCDMISYLGVLSWSAKMIRRNPHVTSLFAQYVRGHERVESIDFPLDTYEAAAVEWLLLGLAELPPPGVSVCAF
jgi:hypothetical protein